jgi:hypothetical protein
MRPAMEWGVPLEERHQVALGSLTDWDAARIFLEVVRRGAGIREFPTYALRYRRRENNTFGNLTWVGHSVFGCPHPGSGPHP